MTAFTIFEADKAFCNQKDEMIENAKKRLLEGYAEILSEPFKNGFEAGLKYACDVLGYGNISSLDFVKKEAAWNDYRVKHRRGSK